MQQLRGWSASTSTSSSRLHHRSRRGQSGLGSSSSHARRWCVGRPAAAAVTRRQSQLVVQAKATDNETHTIITGDIGGTNARLGLWRCGPNAANVEVYAETYPTSTFETFEDCLQAFLDESEVRGARVEAAALAVAGAVENNRCPMTNITWVIDGKQLAAQFGFSTAVLNDFEAVGYGIPALDPKKDLVALNDVPVVPHAPKVVMGPGTGLGAAQLFWDSGLQAYKVIPGEGAHATFAPRGWRQMALTHYVTAKLGHCEIEEVACGRGLELIYEFLVSDPTIKRAAGVPPNKEAPRKLAPEITAAALEGDPLCGDAVDMFLAIVGSEAGAMALRCLAKGGVFIAGGIVPRLLDRVTKTGVLRDAFINRTARERFQYLLRGTPLFVVTNTRVGIIGSREYALQLVRNPSMQ